MPSTMVSLSEDGKADILVAAGLGRLQSRQRHRVET